MGASGIRTASGWLSAVLGLSVLAACVAEVRQPARRIASRAPARPAPTGKPLIPQSDPQAYRICTGKLDAAQILFSPLPNQDKGGGCAVIDAVKLLDIGTPTTNLGAMTCDLAGSFAAWARYAVRPAARLYLGVEVVRIETFGSYACRDMRGSGGTIAGRLSEHAHANAVDVAAFILADGRRISIANDWSVEGAPSMFLHAIHDSACRRFKTVLSPDYNAAHQDHLHFDMGGTRAYCR